MLHGYICPQPLPKIKFGANPSTGVLVGKWVITNFFIYAPLGSHLQNRPINGFSRLMAQMTQTGAGCAFWGLVDTATHLEGKITKNFGNVNRHIQAKCAKY